MPGLSIKERKLDSVINRKSDVIVAKFIDIFSDEILKNLLLDRTYAIPMETDGLRNSCRK